MPSVHSLAEINFIVELGKSQGWFGNKKGVYLGGTIIEVLILISQRSLIKFEMEGELIWSDGSPTDYLLWSEEARTEKGCIAVFSNLLFRQTRKNFR